MNVSGVSVWMRSHGRGLIVYDNDGAGLGESPALSDFLGVAGGKPQPPVRENSFGGIPFAPPQHPGYGITTAELSEAQRRFTNYARLRILGAGDREYGRGSKQSFEDMGLHKLIDELRDEIADAVNYLTFLDIQLSRWKTTLEEKL